MRTGTAVLLAGRYAVRQIVRSRRRKGEFNHRVLLVGGPLHTSELAAVLRRDPDAGYGVVGVCVPGGGNAMIRAAPVVGSMDDVLATARRLNADMVAVTASPAVTSHKL